MQPQKINNTQCASSDTNCKLQKICDSTGAIIDTHDILGDHFWFLIKDQNYLFYFYNQDGPLYQYTDFWIDKRKWYEAFRKYECTSGQTKEIISSNNMQKIEELLPKNENGIYIADFFSVLSWEPGYSFFGDILKFEYWLYISREWPLRIKIYDISINTSTNDLTISQVQWWDEYFTGTHL